MNKAGIKHRSAAFEVDDLPLGQQGGLEQGLATGSRDLASCRDNRSRLVTAGGQRPCTSCPLLPSVKATTVRFISQGH